MNSQADQQPVATRKETLVQAASQADVTGLLAALAAGDRNALPRLLPLVYDELHAIAHRAMRGERPGQTLQTTALVHEAYLKLVDQNRAQWQHRSQFLAVAAQVMRRLLVDHARARGAAKRGGGGAEGGRRQVELDMVTVPGDEGVDLVALDDALVRLAQLDAEQARIVELRFFAGLTVEETAELVGVSPATVKREWATAKAWLHRELGRG